MLSNWPSETKYHFTLYPVTHELTVFVHKPSTNSAFSSLPVCMSLTPIETEWYFTLLIICTSFVNFLLLPFAHFLLRVFIFYIIYFYNYHHTFCFPRGNCMIHWGKGGGIDLHIFFSIFMHGLIYNVQGKKASMKKQNSSTDLSESKTYNR